MYVPICTNCKNFKTHSLFSTLERRGEGEEGKNAFLLERKKEVVGKYMALFLGKSI